MSQTRKDIAQQSTYRTILKVETNNDGTFEITVNGEVVGRSVPERWLEEELCAKRGFCGDEFASIKRQLEEEGRAIVTV